jgi:hypothetical protein
MGRRETAALLMAVVLAATACGGGDDDDDGAGADPLETPTFGEGESDVVTSTGQDPDAPVDSTATTAGDGGTATTTGGEPVEVVGFDDPVGDATPGTGVGTPPPWTDLAGGSLERQGNAYRLTVRLGGAAPTKAPGSATMNIASFYDVDGDGAVDYEIWANLGAEGWGPVWYDDEDHAAPGEASNVTVVVDGDEVRLLFPDVMLGKPDTLRFSIASEYGELATIGTDLARRDDAPDNDQAVAFP